MDKPEKLPWMPLDVADFLKDTTHIRAAQTGAYLLLIMHYWLQRGLPDDDEQLSAIAKMTPAEWRKAKPVLQAFFHDGWKHKRIEEELAKAIEQRTKSSSKARGAAEARWGRQRKDAPSIPRAVPPDAPSPTPSPEPQVDVDDTRGRARVPTTAFREEDFKLGERIMGAQRLNPADPRCVGTNYFAKKWLDGGWDADVIVTTIERVMAKRSDAPNSLKYFETPIADAHAERNRPLPQGRLRTTGPPSSSSFLDVAQQLRQSNHEPDHHHHDTIEHQ